MHPIYKILNFKILANYLLELTFDDGFKRVINFKPILKGELYSSLKNPDYFNLVKLDEETKTIVWPNGADFDPTILHDWNFYEEKFVRMADSWG